VAARRHDLGLEGAPANLAKRRHLLRLFRAGGHSIFVESGTYRGDTVAFFVPHARRIVSVEIEPSLHAAAARRFASQPHVEILLGDAMELIPRIVEDLQNGCLLWLDGHFSGRNTGRGEIAEPVIHILAKLGGIAAEGPVTIVIDDLRLFSREATFPKLHELVEAAVDAFPSAEILTGLDSLVILV
jgi:hypothetical protein